MMTTFLQREKYHLTTKHTKDTKFGKGLIIFSFPFVIFVPFVVNIFLPKLCALAALREIINSATSPSARGSAKDPDLRACPRSGWACRCLRRPARPIVPAATGV